MDKKTLENLKSVRSMLTQARNETQDVHTEEQLNTVLRLIFDMIFDK